MAFLQLGSRITSKWEVGTGDTIEDTTDKAYLGLGFVIPTRLRVVMGYVETLGSSEGSVVEGMWMEGHGDVDDSEGPDEGDKGDDGGCMNGKGNQKIGWVGVSKKS